MTVALLDIKADGEVIASEDVAIKLFPSREAALEWFKNSYEYDEDYSEGATEYFNEMFKSLSEDGHYSDGDGQTYIIREVDE